MIAEASEVESLAFWEPLAMPAAIPAEKQVALRQAGRAALAQRVQPAYAALLRFFREDYVPAARTTLAAEAMPEGEAWYRQQIREYTTLDLEPEAIHQTGLAEVARIRTEMEAIIVETGFEGDFSAFLEFLRTDPQFYGNRRRAAHARGLDFSVDAQIGKHDPAAGAFPDHPGARRHCAVLDRRARQRQSTG